ncbi:MAG: ATP-binding cassette domain-containing protein, partial [Thermomicrobiales bacterium]
MVSESKTSNVVADNDTAEPVMDIQHLSKRFPVGGMLSKGNVHALDDVSFSIPKGRVVALVGESGSGKSTTARVLARLIDPTEGSVHYNGRDIFEDTSRKATLAYRADVQMVFQDPFGSLNPAHPVRYLLERPLKIHKKV